MGQYRRNQDHSRFHTQLNEHEGSHHTFTQSLNFITRTTSGVNFCILTIESFHQPGNWVSIQPRSVWFCWKGNPNDISGVILEESRARWLTVTIKLLIKENISCWLQADQKSFMELTRPLYHSCQREWLENFSWISLSEIYYRLCLR